MRLLHTSDLHLGQELHGFSRAYEHDVFLAWLIQVLKDRAVDLLLITGDIYDSTQASNAALGRFNEFLGRLDRELPRLQVVVIGGNHDSPARVELPQPLLHRKRIHLVGGLPRRAGAVDFSGCLFALENAQGRPAAWCLAIPYLRPGDLPSGPAVGEKADGLLAALYAKALVEAREAAQGLPLLVTGHLNLSGGQLSEQSERRILVGGEEAHASEIFPADLAYVALGHLHRPQQIKGPCLIRYAGAPFPMSMAEKDYRHSVVLVELDGDAPARVDLLETPRPVAFLRLPARDGGDLDSLLAALAALPPVDLPEAAQPFLEVVVDLAAPEPQLRAKVAAAIADKGYRLVRIERRVAGAARGLGGMATVRELSDYSPMDVFNERYRQEYDCAPPAPLRAAFNEVLQAALSPETGPEGARLP